MLSHRTLYLHAMAGVALAKEPETAVDLYTIPLFHANGWGHPHIATQLGIKQVMVRGFDPAKVLSYTQQYQATQINLIPVMAHMLLQVPNALTYDRGSMRDIQIGGAPCSAKLIERMEELFPNARCVVGYGLTETSPFLSYPPPKKTRLEEDEERRARQASLGWPAASASLRVVDSQMHNVPRDGKSVGEIVAMGDNVMDGYYKDPEGTKAALAGAWLRTGDLAVWQPDGSIRFMDRSKDIIISGGENISSLEIESLIATHPAVLECAVIAAPDEKWGEMPLAIVVVRPGQEVNETELSTYLSVRLARFKVPRKFEFRTEALPRTGTLKIKKNLLREKYWQGYPARVQG
jgi:fatty-acyl-CoA synthase